MIVTLCLLCFELCVCADVVGCGISLQIPRGFIFYRTRVSYSGQILMRLTTIVVRFRDVDENNT